MLKSNKNIKSFRICEILSCIRVRDSDPLGRRCGAVARAARACHRSHGAPCNIARPHIYVRERPKEEACVIPLMTLSKEKRAKRVSQKNARIFL